MSDPSTIRRLTVSQGDRVILDGEKCGGLYKLKERNSVQCGVLGISLEGSSSRGGASKKTVTTREPDQSVVRRRRVHSGKSPGRRARVKDFTVWLQSRKELR